MRLQQPQRLRRKSLLPQPGAAVEADEFDMIEDGDDALIDALCADVVADGDMDDVLAASVAHVPASAAAAPAAVAPTVTLNLAALLRWPVQDASIDPAAAVLDPFAAIGLSAPPQVSDSIGDAAGGTSVDLALSLASAWAESANGRAKVLCDCQFGAGIAVVISNMHHLGC